MLLESLFLSTVGFWLFFGIAFCLLIACVEYERPSMATLLLIAIIAILQIFSPYKVASWIIDDPFKFVLFVLAYVGVGVAWSCAKWIFYVKNVKRRLVYAHDQYMRSPESERARHSKVQYHSAIERLMRPDGWSSYDYGLDDDTFKPLIRQNKSRFYLWMAYWPFSMFWTLSHDPLVHLWDYIYFGLAKHLQAYSDRIFGDAPTFDPPRKPMQMNEDGPMVGDGPGATRGGLTMRPRRIDE